MSEPQRPSTGGRSATDERSATDQLPASGGILALFRMLRSGKGPMDGWIARVYDRGIQTAFRELVPPLVNDVAERIGDARRVLDAGCGPGQFTLIVAQKIPHAEVWGIDLAPTMIELARAHAREAGATRVHFEVADVARLPFADASFDVVLSTGSIKHWPDPVAGLREMHRVLAPGGRAFIAEMNRLAPPAAIAANRDRIRHWFCRFIYPRVFDKALSPAEAHRVFAASPFGDVVTERAAFDGCIWMFEARKAAAADGA
jgi:ubiquinone/menaquinone biosynthesis C-methylase UbiE